MADNFVANPGSGGSTFAADEVGVVLFPRLKLTLGADSVNDGDVSLTNPMPVRVVPTADDGCTIFKTISLLAAAQLVKGTNGVVYGLWFSNVSTSIRYLKFWNMSSPTVGTHAPALTIALPAASSGGVSGVFGLAQGIKFGSAISVAATTGVADNDTGAPSANDVIVSVFYK